MASALVAFLAPLVTNPLILTIGGVVVAFIVGIMRGRVTGANAANAKHDQERLAARDEADKIDQAVAGMSDAEVLKGQGRWSRKR